MSARTPKWAWAPPGWLFGPVWSTLYLLMAVAAWTIWRTAPFAHVERFAGFDAVLCFEAGELVGETEGVVVRRKAAGTIHVDAAAHASTAAR